MKFTLRHIALCVVVALLLTTALLSATAHQAAEQQTAFSPACLPFSSENSHAQNSQRTIPNSQFSLSSQDSIRYNYFFLEAVRQQNAGHYAAAFDLLSHALAINPRAAEAYFARATYFSELQQDSLALVDIAEAARLNPANDTYMERLAIAYINRQDFDKAIATYEELAQRDRTRSDILNILVQLYERQKDYQKMIRAIDRIEENEGSSEEITLYKMRVYDLMGDKKSAYRALKALSDKHPSDLTYRVMLGNWLMQHDRSREAFKIFSAAQREDPDNTAVESSLYDYYKATGQDSVAQSLMERMLISPKTDTKSRISMLQQVIRENEEHRDDSTKIISLLHRMMQANPKSSEIAEVNAAYATLKKLPQDTINRALLHVLHLAPDNAGARLQLIQAEWPTKNWDRIIELASPALQYNPEEMAFYYFMGLAYYQKDERDKALEMFRKGVSEINSQSNADIVSDFYAMMGDILYQKGRSAEAFAAYDSCLVWRANNIECLNNYAYYLSERGENLHKAEQMSYRTVKAEPKNATFLDTYAWILFMQGRYAEAQIYIEQAVVCDTASVQNATIFEHAGDIYARNNNIGKALEYWQKALKTGSKSVLLPRKIKLKKYLKA